MTILKYFHFRCETLEYLARGDQRGLFQPNYWYILKSSQTGRKFDTCVFLWSKLTYLSHNILLYHTTLPYYTVPCYIIQYHAKDTTPYYYPKYEIQSNEREKMWNNPSQHSCSFKFGLFPLSLNGQKRWTFASLLSIHCTPTSNFVFLPSKFDNLQLSSMLLNKIKYLSF